MPDPHTHPARFSLAELLRIAGVTLVAGIAIGYLLLHHNSETLQILARIASIVALVTAVFMIFEARRLRRVDRLERLLVERLKDIQFAEGYVAGVRRRPPDDGRHLRSV